jgi:eukaryotic-like serine/threonine-protein kinase
MERLSPANHSFGEFTLDLTRGCLRRGVQEIKLRPKPFEALKYLVENPGRLVSKAELIETIWPDTAVTDDSLVQCLMEVRRALGDEAQQIIKTVPRRGYIFDREVSENGSAVKETVYTEQIEGVHVVIEEEETNWGNAIETVKEPASHSIETTDETPTRSAGYFISKIKRHRRGAAITLATFSVAVAGLAYGLYKFLNKPIVPFQGVSIIRLTMTGKAIEAAISPDGKYVTYVQDEGGRQSLWVRQVDAVSDARIVSPDDVDYGGLTFSRDSNFVFYVVVIRSPIKAGVLYQVPVLGGTPRKVLEDVYSPVTFSADGSRLAFVRWYEKGRESALMISNADGTGEQRLATRKFPEMFHVAPINGPAWSPDGKVIATPALDDGGYGHMYVLEVRVENGAQKRITAHEWHNLGRMAWLSDGSGLLMHATDSALETNDQIWQVSYPSGEAQRIYNDFNGYSGMSLTADSSALVTVQNRLESTIWAATLDGEPSHAKQITSGSGRLDGFWGLCSTPNGKIIYVSNASGGQELWIMNNDGSNQKQLTFNIGRIFSPSVSPDGRSIVFDAGAELFRIDSDGSNRQKLNTGKMFPLLSPDGSWLVYSSPQDGWTLWKAPLSGGQPLQLTQAVSLEPAISPDGQLIAYTESAPNSAPQMMIIRFEGGQPVKTFTVMPHKGFPIKHWALDGRAVTYIVTESEVDNIWSQPLDGNPRKQLTNFKAGHISWFDWSGDGQQLIFARSVSTSDVVLLRDSR